MSLETKSSGQWFLCQIVFTGLYPLQQSFYSQQVHVVVVVVGGEWPSFFGASKEVDSYMSVTGV